MLAKATKIFLVVLTVAIAAVISLETNGLEVSAQLDPAKMIPERGHAFIGVLPTSSFFSTPGDSEAAGNVSTLRLLENDCELGPPHAIHEEIRQNGHGRFSHWNDGLYFSSSDNTDPRANGRTYHARCLVRFSERVGWKLVGMYSTALCLLSVVLLRTKPGLQSSVGASSSTQRGVDSDSSFWPAWGRNLGQSFALRAPIAALALLSAAYFAALLAVVAAVQTQKLQQGGFKVNFEYKVF